MIILKRLIFTTILFLIGTRSQAQVVFTAAFISKNPTVDCYKLYVMVTKPHPEFGTVYASEAEAWHFKGDCVEDKIAVSLGTKPSCTPLSLNGITFITGKDAPSCFEEFITDNASKEALQATIDFCLGHLIGFKGMPTAIPSGLLVYPIPAHNYLNIATGFKNIQGTVMATMTDATGKKVFEQQVQNPGGAAFTLCLKDFKPGIYILLIKEGTLELAKQSILIQ